VDFFCHVTHLRAYALDLPVPPHGDCEYCEGGTRYGEVLRSAAALKDGKRASGAATWIPGSPLPMVSEATAATTVGCSSGGCTSWG